MAQTNGRQEEQSIMTDHATRARELLNEIHHLNVTGRPVEVLNLIAAALDQAAQPVWTTKLPAIAGTYWYRKNKEHDPWIADVYEIGGCLTTTLGGSVKDMGGEWAGPLPLPREA